MNLLFRWGGAAMIMAGALLINREYGRYLDRRVSELQGFLMLLTHAEGKISKYLSYGRGLWKDFSNDALSKCGFLKLLDEKCSVSEAFEKCKDKTALSSDAKQLLSSSFREMGQGYKDGELSVLSEIKNKLSARLETEAEQAVKDKKVASALILGGAIATVIMAI